MDRALWLLPIVGALIGWLTNEVAVRMLFRPKNPVPIPLSGLTLQGVLPRRHADLAESIGKTVADDLLPATELIDRLDVGALRTDLVTAVADHVDNRLQGVARLLPGNLRTRLSGYLREVVEREADTFMEAVLVEVRERVASHIDVQEIVTEKMLQLNLDELEVLARRIAGKELQAIVIFGAVLGFLIGLLQMVVVAWLLPTATV